MGVTDRASTQDDSFAGLSHLPRYKVEQIHKEKNLSPRSIKKRVHAFVDENIISNKQATAVMFEELCKSDDPSLISNKWHLTSLCFLPSSPEYFKDPQARAPLET